MFRKVLSPLGGLPAFCALAPVIWCLSFGLTHQFVGSSVGRQSSTFGITTFFTLVEAPVFGLVGFWLGKLAHRVFSPHVSAQAARILKWLSLAVLAAIAVIASCKASAPILSAERDAQPRVVVNTTQLRKRTGSLPTESMVRASRAYDYLEKKDVAMDWGEGDVRFARQGNALEVKFLRPGTSLLIPIAGISYVLSVDAIPVKFSADTQPMLALLITGRATGERDLLAVISESRELVYLEVLERSWNFRLNSLAISSLPAGDQLLVGSDPQNLLLYY